MRLSAWLLLLLLGAVGLAALTASAAEIESKSLPASELEENRRNEATFFISGIIDILLRPLKKLLLTQINSIINSIKDQGGLIIGNVKQMIDALLELIRPFIIRILDQINNIIGAGVELRERIRMAVQALFDYIGIISNANKEIIKSLIEYIVDKLLPTASELEVFHRLLTEVPSPLLLGGIKDKLIAPIVEFAKRQLQSLINSLVDQIGIIGANILDYADQIAELIRPFVIRILDLTNNLHAEVTKLRAAVREVVAAIIGGIGSIASAGADTVARLIDRVTDIIVSKIIGKAVLLAPNQSEAFLIIDRIIGSIVQPILNKINGILDQIRQLIEDKTDEAKAKVQRLIDELSLLLRDPIIKIIGVLSNIGIEIGDVAKAIKRALETIIDNISGIHEANKAIFKSILSYVISGLLKLIDGDAAAARSVMDFSILLEIISRILGPITKLINEVLDKLRTDIENQIGEAAELIRRAVETLAGVLAAPIAKIVEIFIQIGIAGRDLVENVRTILQLIANNLAGIAEANKQLLNRMLSELMDRIIDIIRANFP